MRYSDIAFPVPDINPFQANINSHCKPKLDNVLLSGNNPWQMKLLYRISGALIIAAIFAYLTYTMYAFEQLSGRQFRLVILIVSFMVGMLGKIAAAIITALIGLGLSIFSFLHKDDEDKDKIIPTRHL
jgi:ABC-type multidrug transport system permease subunit